MRNTDTPNVENSMRNNKKKSVETNIFAAKPAPLNRYCQGEVMPNVRNRSGQAKAETIVSPGGWERKSEAGICPGSAPPLLPGTRRTLTPHTPLAEHFPFGHRPPKLRYMYIYYICILYMYMHMHMYKYILYIVLHNKHFL